MVDRLCYSSSPIWCTHEIDDVGDLSQWDYLTQTFDTADIFQEQSSKSESSNDDEDDTMDNNLFALVTDPPSMAALLVVDDPPQSSSVPTTADMHCISTNDHLPGYRNEDPPAPFVLEQHTPIASIALSKSSSKQLMALENMDSMSVYTTASRPTTPLDFTLEPFSFDGIVSATPKRSEDIFTTNNLAPDVLVDDLDGYLQSERACGVGGLVRASSCVLGSASFPFDESFRHLFQPNHVSSSSSSMVNATIPLSVSCPTLPSADHTKRSSLESFASGRRHTTSQVNYSPHEDTNSWHLASSKRSSQVPGMSSSSDTAATSNHGQPLQLSLCKPLKVYNYYYRDERDNIVNGMKQHGDPLPLPVNDFSQAKLEQLLHHRWFVDPQKKRRLHRKQHGKIEFSTLSQVIAGRWRSLPAHGRDFYRRVARADQENYDQYRSSQAAP